MSEKHLIVCDGCGREEDGHEFEGFWFQVTTVLSSPHQESVQEKLARVMTGQSKMSDVADFGHFCSLACLANWASSRAALRALDAEMEAGVTYDKPFPPGEPQPQLGHEEPEEGDEPSNA